MAGNQHQFELKIMDNGKGFDTQAVRQGGLGLITMTERAERLGGRLEIDSSPGAGTLIRMRIDRPEAAALVRSESKP